jgi:hypothetical protein
MDIKQAEELSKGQAYDPVARWLHQRSRGLEANLPANQKRNQREAKPERFITEQPHETNLNFAGQLVSRLTILCTCREWVFDVQPRLEYRGKTSQRH